LREHFVGGRAGIFFRLMIRRGQRDVFHKFKMQIVFVP
jgi:hypothetical protein